jgi:hypothetical protein
LDARTRILANFTPDSVQNHRHTAQRILVHLLLAAFLANAANKFFVADLEYEATHGFYQRIFEFRGDAPDQYRILPLLPLKWITTVLPFNTAVLLFNAICAFLAFEVFARLMKRRLPWEILAANALFAVAYIYTQYTGWRPDTMGLVLLAAVTTWASQHIRDRSLRDLAILLGILALGFSRADLAFAFAAYFSIYKVRSGVIRLVLPILPVAIQALLQLYIFPEATYYTQTFMLMDNLSGYYLLRNPATYLILAAMAAFYRQILAHFSWIWKQYPYFVWIFAGYLALVLVMGRVNEYRIFLPFWPILLTFWREARDVNEKKAGTV